MLRLKAQQTSMAQPIACRVSNRARRQGEHAWTDARVFATVASQCDELTPLLT